MTASFDAELPPLAAAPALSPCAFDDDPDEPDAPTEEEPVVPDDAALPVSLLTLLPVPALWPAALPLLPLPVMLPDDCEGVIDESEPTRDLLDESPRFDDDPREPVLAPAVPVPIEDDEPPDDPYDPI